MGYTTNSIVIKKDIKELFLIINNIKNWPTLHNYQKAEVLEIKKVAEKRLLFKFKIIGDEKDSDGNYEEWISERIIDMNTFSARGVRLEPMFPFKHWILDVLLKEENEGTRMTWIQDFSMDPKTGHTDEEIEGYINEGSKDELNHFKKLIESGDISEKMDESEFE